MKSILLMMRRASVAQGIQRKMEVFRDLQVTLETNYEVGIHTIYLNQADVVLIEAAEYGKWDTLRCLKLCEQIREAMPDCRLVFLVSEMQKEAVVQVIEAKRTGVVDNFLFYESSMDYLAACLRAS